MSPAEQITSILVKFHVCAAASIPEAFQERHLAPDMRRVQFQAPSLPVYVSPRRSDRPKQEIKRTHYPVNLNTLHKA